MLLFCLALLFCLFVTILAPPTLPALQPGTHLTSESIGPRAPEDEPRFDPNRARAVSNSLASAVTRFGYLVNWDQNSFSSLKRNATALDVVIADWLFVAGQEPRLTRVDPAKETEVRQWIGTHAPNLGIYPLVNNFDPTTQKWDPAAIAAILESDASRSQFATQFHDAIRSARFPGAVLDFQGFAAPLGGAYTQLVEEAGRLFQASGMKLAVAVSVGDPAFDVAALGRAAAHVIVKSQDATLDDGQPGPIAGQGWFELALEEVFRAVDPAKVVVGIGSHGYDWSSAGAAREISVQEAWELVLESGAQLTFEQTSLNPTFSYVDADGVSHAVWFLDGVTGFNHMAAALSKRPGGIALWRLGTEDPTIWSVFARGHTADAEARESLKRIQSGYDLVYIGEGEALRVSHRADTPGQRSLTFDPKSNLITDQRILTFPKSTTITRSGAREDKVIALTFDDGPDPAYTPQILDILAEKRVPATFFIVGHQGALHQDLLRRIYVEGHDIGNHTFSHVNTAHVSADHLRLELNATQRLIEATIGVRTTLFRPPFAQDIEPDTIDAAGPLLVAAELGYTTIGMKLDPKDWARMLPRQIVAGVLEGARRGDGNVVLLHDAGGNRTPTVKALPEIIDRLRAEGYRFVTVHELLGLSRAAAMPKVDGQSPVIATMNGTTFWLYGSLSSVAQTLFEVAIVLGLLRIFVMTGAAIVHRRREARRRPSAWVPGSVAVLVPAYNEEKVIEKTIRSLLASTLERFEIIVIDDGSKDGTAQAVRREFAGDDRVRVLEKANGGKAAALNYGLGHTDADVIVALDADTIFEPDALALLVARFEDEKIGAVAGSAHVGNVINMMTGLQSLEYITSQNVDRRAMSLVNGISVVPGAIGAWRRSALLATGGFTSDTLAEDADATLRLEVAGWRVEYEPKAIARTEAPETVSAFLKQRFRWMFGTLQVAYKHRGAFFSRKAPGVGFVALPNILMFQFLFTLIAPIVDLILIWNLVVGAVAFGGDPAGGVPVGVSAVVGYWLAFQAVELAAAAIAIHIGGDRTAWRLLPLILVQRFCYRQLLYWTAIRTALAALKGNFVGWGKLQRTGSVVMAPAAPLATAATVVSVAEPEPVAAVPSLDDSGLAVRAASDERIVRLPVRLAEARVPDRIVAA